MIERVEREQLKELMEEITNNFVDTYNLFRESLEGIVAKGNHG